MNDEFAAFFFSALAVFGFIAFFVWHSSRERFEKRRLRLEEQSRILDRLGSGAEMAEFLKTDEGRKFLDRLDEPDAPPRRNGYRIGAVGLLTTGAIVTSLGVGFCIAGLISTDDGPLIGGLIIVSTGIGCLLASWIQLLLGRRWGMLDDATRNGRPRRTFE